LQESDDVSRRAKAYLQARFNEPVSLDELATVASISRYHLVRSFTAKVGLPPHAYQLHVRLAHARAMLYAGMSPVDVAAQVGFADQSHLTRHFKRVWRTTPGDYSRRVG
jgi:AraC-like DNA-binding protein